MSRVVILMYHALWRGAQQLSEIEPEERPYALSSDQFAQQLDALRETGIAVLDPAELQGGVPQRGGVILSFDDGHASNAELALPELCKRGLKAIFFITTGFVGHRPGYCDRGQMCALSAAGMEIGGHGHTHRFLTELGDDELDEELRRSRETLRDILGRDVAQMSFPGGRGGIRVSKAARAAGFTVLHGSQVGSLRPGDFLRDAELPRIAVRASVSLPVFTAFARADPMVMLRTGATAMLKNALRSSIGSERYHRLYSRLKV